MSSSDNLSIVVNALPLKGLLTGIARYTRNLYRCLSAMDGITVSYFDGLNLTEEMPCQADPASWIKQTDFAWKLPHPVVFALRVITWIRFEHALNRIIPASGAELYHETAFTPAALRYNIPQVFTLHDLSLLHKSATHPAERVWFFKLFFKRRLKYAKHILVPSNFVKKELCEMVGFPADRVSVTPEGVDPVFRSVSKAEISKTLTRYRIKTPYLLFVGTLEPRKNLDVIIHALPHLPPEINLVLAGWKGWGSKSWQARIKQWGLSDRVFIPGYVDEKSLVAIYNGALALVYPSTYEGFGLPVLEAMACGCPVICSNVASIPEVAGNAALYMQPFSTDDLIKAVMEIYENPERRNEMIEAGFKRASLFAWEKTAELTVKVFKKVVSLSNTRNTSNHKLQPLTSSESSSQNPKLP
ncbi:MAG: glycosyltransferase family 4 protein [Deltaproteobacteria bacterium]|nr:glycosyltransferase family 4 protein [Deltaproteobacteria bacterium]MBW2069282.1 glycosyltransferase family 4 protein [Deltaproteobacteria bacterium]